MRSNKTKKLEEQTKCKRKLKFEDYKYCLDTTGLGNKVKQLEK